MPASRAAKFRWSAESWMVAAVADAVKASAATITISLFMLKPPIRGISSMIIQDLI